MRIITNPTDIDPQQWRELSISSPTSSFFQSHEAFTFFSSNRETNAKVIAVEEDGNLKGLVVANILKEQGWIKGHLSSRAIINGGPLLASKICTQTLIAFLSSATKILSRGNIYLETRNFNDYSQWMPLFLDAKLDYQPHYNFHIDTDGFECRMGKTRQYEIRRAIKEGVTIDTHPSIEDIGHFYTILSLLYRTKIKYPLFSLSFFEELYRQPFSHFIMVKYRDHVIGGTVCVGLPGQTLYEWYACGDNSKGKYLFPSTMATYGAIRYAATNGHQRFDMMGAGSPGDGGYGVRDFKAQFGGTLVEQGRFLHVYNRPVYALGKLYIKLRNC